MTPWPNWIDLLIVTLIIRGGYNGFGHGLITELLSLIGAVTITSLTLNYAEKVSAWVGQWGALAPHVAEVLGFWALFLVLTAAVRFLVRRLAEAVEWERLHWMVQGIGLVFGGLRALWWAGFFVVALSSSGMPFLRQGVETRSVFGPRLLRVAHEGLVRAADRFPGATLRSRDVPPPLKPAAK